jgi:acyl carrier protein
MALAGAEAAVPVSISTPRNAPSVAILANLIEGTCTMAEVDGPTAQTLRIIQTVVAGVLAEAHGRPAPAIEAGRHLTEFVTDSVQMLQVHARLTDALGKEIEASILFEYDSIAALAEHLAGARARVAVDTPSAVAAGPPR